MNKLHELRRKRAALVVEWKALQTKEDDLPDDQAAPQEDIDRMTALETQVAALDGRISRLEQMQAADATDAEAPEGEAIDESGKFIQARNVKAGPGKVPATARKPPLAGKGFQAARFVMGILLAKDMGRADAAQFIGQRFNDDDVVKALNTVGVATGGALVPQDFATDIIELLTARVAVRRFNPQIIEMPRGNLTLPRLSGGATAGYQGELDDTPVSQPTFDDVQLNAKKLTSLVPVTNDLLRRAPIGVERIITDNMVQAMGLREDIAFLRGDGSTNSPVGLLNQCLAVNKLIGLALPTTGNDDVINAVSGILYGMMLTLENNLSRMLNPGWILPPMIATFIATLRNGQALQVFGEEMRGGTLLGYPFVKTTQIPTNLAQVNGQTGVTNNSEIYFADFADVVIGDTMEMRVDTSNEATYKDAGGNVVSAFQRDQTLFRVITENDIGVRHKGSIAVGIVPAWAPAGYNSFNSGSWFYAQTPNALGSAAGSVGGANPPTGSNNPGNSSAVAPGGTLPGLSS